MHERFDMQCARRARVAPLLFRLVMYVERDLRKATPLKENPSQSAHLSQCLDLLTMHLSATPAVILGTHRNNLHHHHHNQHLLVLFCCCI